MTDPRIRLATPADWPAIWPVFQEIVTAGETYAYPEGLTSEQAREALATTTEGATGWDQILASGDNLTAPAFLKVDLYQQWNETNYRSVIMAKRLTTDAELSPDAARGARSS